MLKKQKDLLGQYKPDLYGDSLPYLHYVEEMGGFILEEGGLMACFKCQPLNGVNQEIQNALEDLFKSDMPTNMFVQISMFASPDIKWMLDRYESNRGGRSKDRELSNLLDSVAVANYDYLKTKVHETMNDRSDIVLRDFEIWITLTLPTREQMPAYDEVDLFVKKRNQLQATLDSIHLCPERMNAEMFLHRMKVLHNWQDDATWKTRPREFDASRKIRDQILDKGNSIRVHEDGIEFGDTTKKGKGKYVKLLSVAHYPTHMTFGQLYDLIVDWRKGQSGIRCPFLMTLNIHYPNQTKAKGEIAKNRAYTSHMASTVFGKWIDRLSWQKQDYDKFNDAIERDGAQIVNAYLQIALFCDDKYDGDSLAQAVMSHGSRTKWTLNIDRFFCLPLLKASLPGGQNVKLMKHLRRYSIFPSTILKHLAPLISGWKGNGFKTPVYPLVTREGQLHYFDPFTSDGNFNCAVAAASGSGKSFFINGLITNLLSSGRTNQGKIVYDDDEQRPLHKKQPHDGGRVFVIDVGRSYEKLVEMLGGKFVVFDDNFEYTLNPFKSIHDFDGKDGQADMLLSLLSYMAAPSGKLDEFQTSELMSIITLVWTTYENDGSIDHVMDICKKHDDKRVQDMGVQLQRWCKGGVYGEYFRDDKPPLTFDGHFVVFELEELKGKKTLQTAVLLQCISCIQHEMFLSGRDLAKAFVLDEAWEFIGDGEGSEFIKLFLESGWRRFRKTNAAGIAISQGISDYYQSPVGEAIIANSQWKVLLRQEPEQVDQAQASGKFSGGPGEFDLIKSLHTRKGEYSEIYIRGSSGREVVRLYVPRFMQLMFTTDPEELRDIDRYRKNGFSISEAISEIMKQEGHAVVKDDSKEVMHSRDILDTIY